MHIKRTLALQATAALLAVLSLSSCGGGDGVQTPRVPFTRMVVFGDSLSDMGTYATPALVATTQTDGRFTVNTGGGQTKIWVDHVAAQVGVTVPCAARRGLLSSGQLAPFASAPVTVAGCTGYAEGGSRVTNPVGPSNPSDPDAASAQVGALTEPVIDQMNRFLTDFGGSYAGTDLVAVFAGGNDLLVNLTAVETAGGTQQSIATAAQAMQTAATELVGYVKTLVVAKGARHVLVVNIPDASITPKVQDLEQTVPGTAQLTQGLLQAFNATLQAGLADTSEVIFVDAFTSSDDEHNHMAQYGLSDVRNPACDLTSPGGPLLFPSSLVCAAAALVSGANDHYEFADSVHPTPYGHLLLAQLITKRLIESGRL